MLWIFIGLIYIICITSNDASYVTFQNFAKMDMKEKARVVDDILGKTNVPPDDKKLQYRKDWNEFKQKMEKLNFNAKKTVRRLRKIADRLDEAWLEHKIKFACSSVAFVIGGIITHRTGSVTGLGFGLAGAIVSIKARFIKDGKDLEDYKIAEKLLEETKDNFIAVGKMTHEWLDEKEYGRVIYIYQLAKLHKAANGLVLTILREIIFAMRTSMGKEAATFLKKAGLGAKAAFQDGTKEAARAGAQVADDAVQVGAKTLTLEVAKNETQFVNDLADAGWRTVVHSQKNLLAPLNTALLLLDAVDLGFTIMDLVGNKGSDAAKDLREKAREIEDAFIQ